MRKTKLMILFVSMILMFTSCFKTRDQQLRCLNRIINKDQKSKDYLVVQQLIKDTINLCVNNKSETMQHYKSDLWMVDAIIFSKQRSKCFIILIGIDTTSNATSDFADYGVGEMDNKNHWTFYFAGLPSLYIPKRTPRNNLENISEIARKEIIRGGVLKSCSLNEEYISDWFNVGLLKSQERFLRRRL